MPGYVTLGLLFTCNVVYCSAHARSNMKDRWLPVEGGIECEGKKETFFPFLLPTILL